ncbi:MAG: hypothetical protein U5L09_00795 [Bacteroidales bacterium]|nr:hypothetical protein [Bacteroidales bacterium]
MAEMIFVLVVSGFVIYEILAEWDMTKNMLMFFPNLVAESLSIKSAVLFGITKSTILFAILPFIIWYIPFGLARLNGNKIKISNYFLQYGIAFIPVMAAAHLSKAVLKTVSRLPYFEHLPTDLTGMTTAQKIVDGQIVLQQNPQWAQILLSVVVTIVMLSGIGLSIKIIKKLNLKQQQKYNAAWFYLIPAIYGGVFLVMLIAWRWM